MHALPQREIFLRAVSALAGFLYVAAWSLSFYPQPLLNIQRRTTAGLTPDFPVLNIIGFGCYTLSTSLYLYSPRLRSEYAAKHPGSPEPTVRGNDLAFGVHALVICTIVYSQFWPGLWGWQRDEAVVRKLQGFTRVILGLVIFVAGCAAVVVVVHGDAPFLSLVEILGFVKLVLTMLKYIPQVVENVRKQSTIGWPISQILLDFSGGVLSLLQLVIDSSLQADWSGLAGNPLKLGLANISLAFDVVFMLQHFVFYGPVNLKASRESGSIEGHAERGPLLSSDTLPET